MRRNQYIMIKVGQIYTVRVNNVASEFATSSGSTLPIIGVDLPITLLSKWTLDSTWIHDDEAWRGTLASISTSDRRYADSVREAVQDAMRGKSDNGLAASKGWMWLFSVREARVSRVHTVETDDFRDFSFRRQNRRCIQPYSYTYACFV